MQSWCPYLVKDIDELEKVQSRMTKLVPGLQDMSSEARLVELSLPTLKLRRQRGDLIELYKILNGHEGTVQTTGNFSSSRRALPEDISGS